jgi:hypothetical protein
MKWTLTAGARAGGLPLLCIMAACDYDAPLGPPRADVLEDRFIGAWAVESTDEPDSGGGIYVSRFNAAEYLITVADSAGSNDQLRSAFARDVRYPPGLRRDDPENGLVFYAAHFTVFEGATFLNLRALAREPVAPTEEWNWLIMRVDFVGDRALLRPVAVRLPPPRGAEHTSREIQRALAGRVHAADSYADDVLVLQRVPLRRGERP